MEKTTQLFMFLERYKLWLLLVSITFFRLPPFILPNLNISLINSHTIARFFIIFLLIQLWLTKKTFSKNKLIFYSLLILIIKSLSIINAVSVEGFLLIYKDFITGVAFLFVSLNIINQKNQIKLILKVIIITLIINIILQSIIFFKEDIYINYISNFLYPKYFENFLIHYERGRYFVDIFDISLIPILIFIFLKSKKKVAKIFLFSLSFLMMVFSFVSGFRVQLLVGLMSLLGMVFLIKYTQKIILLLFIILFFLLQLFTNKSLSIKLLTLERLNLTEKEAIQPIFSRLDFWKKAYNMGISSPLLGIGLGNYYDYYSPKPILQSSLFNPKNKLFEVTAFHPHNIFFAAFAETGILGIMSLLLLLSYFIKNDLSVIRSSSFNKVLIISFWSLFLFSLVGPDNIIQYIILFWILRVLIEKSEKLSFTL